MTVSGNVVLKQQKVEFTKRFHPWIFSGAIKCLSGKIADGDLVRVVDEHGKFLALGHYATGSIAVRIFSFSDFENVEDCFVQRIANAILLRKQLGLFDSAHTNSFRLVHGEGDGLPGLIVDVYAETAVIQPHSKGMYQIRKLLSEIIVQQAAGRIKSVYNKAASSSGFEQKDEVLFGDKADEEIVEHGNKFFVDIAHGQKTGFFIDQRENRKLLGDYVHGKRVLNTFCYSGGFSVYALKAGAAYVDSVDASAKAIELTDKNIALNNQTTHQSHVGDVFDFLAASETGNYDVIVLDPPAFAKHHSAKHQAIQAYKRLNAMAMKRIAPSGIVFTFSCSQAIDAGLFEGAVTAAAIEARRDVKILHRVTQPPDHPVSIFHPEGNYLKGLVLMVL